MNDWVEGQCSVTCGGGTRTDTRTVKHKAKYGGLCKEKLTRVVKCNTKCCPGKFYLLQ